MTSLTSAVNEVVSISSTIFAHDANIKFFNNISSSGTAEAVAALGGYWESVYDSAPTSSLSTAMLDLTYGYTPASPRNVSPVSSSNNNNLQNEKIKIYRHFASQLLGNADAVFEIDGAQHECFFIMIKRCIKKDEIKKGSTSIKIKTAVSGTLLNLLDTGAAGNFRQAAGGDYSPLRTDVNSPEKGQIWYNAGVVVLPSSLWSPTTAWIEPTGASAVTLSSSQETGTINNLVDGLRLQLDNITIHNQTNLYSTIYFCRATNSEFNYSSNPTFVDANQRIVVTAGSNILESRTYITTVGLYDANDNLLGVAKLNKPLMKCQFNELLLRLRLDF